MNIATGLAETAPTNSDGQYRIFNLLPAEFLITHGNVNGTFTNNPTFGQIHSIGSTPRQLQFAAKL